jgi:hypothetical protein
MVERTARVDLRRVRANVDGTNFALCPVVGGLLAELRPASMHQHATPWKIFYTLSWSTRPLLSFSGVTHCFDWDRLLTGCGRL